MFKRLSAKFREKPSLFYSMSIAATWAGAGSFIVGTQIAQSVGIFPWLLWALGNTLCCVVFGLLANKFPKLRAVATSKPAQWVMGLMCIFQIWVNMNGILESLSPAFGKVASMIIVYGVSIFFIMFYLKRATARNVGTDNLTWGIVYLLIGILVIISMITNGVHGIPTDIVAADIKDKAWLCFTLSFGGFFYPTYWELLDYNEKNDEGTKPVNIKNAFIRGGLLFGAYLLFVLAGAFTTYSPAVNALKGILISLVAISSLSSFIYGAMINFGKKGGIVVDVVAVGAWQLLVPMGVMGVWTLMQNVRIWLVLGMFAIAAVWYFIEKRRAAKKEAKK